MESQTSTAEATVTGKRMRRSDTLPPRPADEAATSAAAGGDLHTLKEINKLSKHAAAGRAAAGAAGP